MLPTPTTSLEAMKQVEYYKKLIKQTFDIIDYQKNGTIDKKEVSQIMRYLLQFPSEAQIRDHIIEKIDGDEPSDYIKFEKFEPFMLQVLKENEFEPSPSEHLMTAFRVLDPEGKGYIHKDVMKELITTKGIPLRVREIENFLSFAEDKTGQVIFYEDYINKLFKEIDSHREKLTKDYENFKIPKLA